MRQLIREPILYVLIFVLAIMFGIPYCVYYQKAHKWEQLFSEEEMWILVAEIDNTPRHEEVYYELLAPLFPGAANQGLHSAFFWTLYAEAYYEQGRQACNTCMSACFLAAHYVEKRTPNSRTIAPNAVSFALNKYTDPEKCFDYYISHVKREWDLISERYYCAPFLKLRYEDQVGVVVRWDNPRINHNVGQLEKEVFQFIQKLDENK